MLAKKRLLIVLGLVVSLVAGLVAAGLLLAPRLMGGGPMRIQISLGDPLDPASAAATSPPPAIPQEAMNGNPERVRGILYDLGSKVVNLADPGGLRYLKVGIVVEILPMDQAFYALDGSKRAEQEDAIRSDLDKLKPVLEDVITSRLSDKTFEEVFTVAGKEQLKNELRDDFNARLTIGRVRDIYFTDFVIQ